MRLYCVLILDFDIDRYHRSSNMKNEAYNIPLNVLLCAVSLPDQQSPMFLIVGALMNHSMHVKKKEEEKISILHTSRINSLQGLISAGDISLTVHMYCRGVIT